MRCHKIVAIDKGNEGALHHIESGIASGAQSGIWLVNHFHARVALCPLLGDGAGGIGAAIVHHNHLQSGIGLCHDAFEALFQIGCHIIGRHNHTNQIFHFFYGLMVKPR